MTRAIHVGSAARDALRGLEPRRSGPHTDAASNPGIATLIRTHHERLFRLMCRKLNNRELARDLSAESIKVTLEHASLGRLSEARLVAGYVFKVGMNLLRNHRRNMDNRADVRVSTEAFENLAQPEAADEIEGEQNRQLVLQLFAALGARDREIIRRFYLEDEDRDQICRELGLSLASFNQVICRARQRLKTVLQSRGLGKADFFCLSVLL